MATTAGRISGTRNIRVNEVWAATWIATDPSVPNNTIAPESLGNVNTYKYVKPMIQVFDCVADGGFGLSSADEFISGVRGCSLRFPAITSKILELPAGKRALKLTRYDQGEMYCEVGDQYKDGLPSPWAENLGILLRNDWTRIATVLKKSGCLPDYIIMDSPPGESNIFAFWSPKLNANFITNIISDPKASIPWYGIKSFNNIYTNNGQHKLIFDEIYNRVSHSQTHKQYLYWERAVGAIQTELLNEFIVKPTLSIFGISKFSNYGSSIVEEDTDIYDFNGHPYLSENVVGDASAPVLYAGWNQPNVYGILKSDTTRIVRKDYADTNPFPSTAWNQFLNLVQIIRGVKRESPNMPIRPWIASVDFGPEAPFNSAWNTDSMQGLYWESIKHFILTGADMLNYWNSSDDSKEKLIKNCTKMNSLLTDINKRIGGYTLQQENTSRIDYLADYVISGVPVGASYVWRVTPKPGTTLVNRNNVVLTVDIDGGAWMTTTTSVPPEFTTP